MASASGVKIPLKPTGRATRKHPSGPVSTSAAFDHSPPSSLSDARQRGVMHLPPGSACACLHEGWSDREPRLHTEGTGGVRLDAPGTRRRTGRPAADCTRRLRPITASQLLTSVWTASWWRRPSFATTTRTSALSGRTSKATVQERAGLPSLRRVAPKRIWPCRGIVPMCRAWISQFAGPASWRSTIFFEPGSIRKSTSQVTSRVWPSSRAKACSDTVVQSRESPRRRMQSIQPPPLPPCFATTHRSGGSCCFSSGGFVTANDGGPFGQHRRPLLLQRFLGALGGRAADHDPLRHVPRRGRRRRLRRQPFGAIDRRRGGHSPESLSRRPWAAHLSLDWGRTIDGAARRGLAAAPAE